MTILGLILVLIGGLFSFLSFSDKLPEQVASLGLPPWVWLIAVAVGGLLLFLNRRPGD